MAGELLALTERDRLLLAEVARLGVVSREQLGRLKFFGSKTRANERLRRLTNHGYLATRRQALTAGGPRLLYLPGRVLADTQDIRRRVAEASEAWLTHELGLVDVRLAFEAAGLTTWRSSRELAGTPLGVVPDAYLEIEVKGRTVCAFVEYDRGTETLGRIERKIRAYLQAAYSGTFERLFRRKYFRLLLVADSNGRLHTLSTTVARLTDKIVRLSLLSDLTNAGPLESIWRHPGRSALSTLTES